jgi:hypothetical protein
MKNIIKITLILSWFNLVIGSILILSAIFMGLASGNILNILTLVILPSAFVLHSYAALQLRKSILHPEIPLGKQTPVGIRFIGYAALFFAFINIVYAINILGHTQDFVQQVKLPPEAANLNVAKLLKFVTAFSLLFSMSIVFNVIINFRLLKWYIIETRE